jgi:DNA-binding transcriptional LysR family regulator
LARLRFNQLELVCVLAESGSMHAASGRLHLCTPALSKGLREVERLVGQRLFERSARGVSATAAGERFLREARAVLNQLARLGESIEQKPGRRQATLTLGAAASVAWCLLPGAVARLRQSASMPRIRVAEGQVLHLGQKLLAGELDAVVTIATPESIQELDDPALMVEQMVRVDNVVVAAPEIAGAGRQVRMQALRDRPWLLPPPSFVQRLIVQQAFLEAGEIPPEPVVECVSMPTLLRLAQAGLGLTAVPRYAAAPMLRARQLRIVRTAPTIASVAIHFAYRRTATNLSIVHAVRDALYAQLRAAEA